MAKNNPNSNLKASSMQPKPDGKAAPSPAPTATAKPLPQPTQAQPPAQRQEPREVPGPTHEQIAKRAYEIYSARGGHHGTHHDDWLQAERELKLGRQ